MNLNQDFLVGLYGSTDSSNITYSIDNNIITGKYLGTLKPENALTVRLELPDGYFSQASNNYFDMYTKSAIFLPIVFVVIVALIWFVIGRDKKINTTSYYTNPPERI